MVEEIATVVEASSASSHAPGGRASGCLPHRGRAFSRGKKRRRGWSPLVREAAAGMGERCAGGISWSLSARKVIPAARPRARAPIDDHPSGERGQLQPTGYGRGSGSGKGGRRSHGVGTGPGVGVPAGEEKKIFERFYQVEDLTHRSTPAWVLGSLSPTLPSWGAHGGTCLVRAPARQQVNLPLHPAHSINATSSARVFNGSMQV